MSKADAFRTLAGLHMLADNGITRVVRVRARNETDTDGQPVKLLMVNTNTPAAGVIPLGFPPADQIGVPIPSILMEVTPDEYADLRANGTPLPHGWTLADDETVTAPAGN